MFKSISIPIEHSFSNRSQPLDFKLKVDRAVPLLVTAIGVLAIISLAQHSIGELDFYTQKYSVQRVCTLYGFGDE